MLRRSINDKPKSGGSGSAFRLMGSKTSPIKPLQYSSERIPFPILARLSEISCFSRYFDFPSPQIPCDMSAPWSVTPLGGHGANYQGFPAFSRIALSGDAFGAICDLVSHLARFNSGGFHYPNHGLNSSCYRRRLDLPANL